MPKANWTPQTETKLLHAVLDVTLNKTGKPNWDNVAVAMGEGYTASSTQQKFNKLRKAHKGPKTGDTSPTQVSPTQVEADADTSVDADAETQVKAEAQD